MAEVIDVAEYILDKIGTMTAMKMQKLVYYCQAWHLVWTEHPLFEEKIEAWRNGPIVPELYEIHKGHFKLHPGFFFEKHGSKEPKALVEREKDVIDRVLEYYGHRDPHWLSQLTHMEEPWKTARHKSTHEKQADEITHHAMFEYYCSL